MDETKNGNIGEGVITSKFYPSIESTTVVINTTISYFITVGATENTIVRTTHDH